MKINYNGTVTISDACISLRPDAGVSVEGNDVTKIIWDDETIAAGTIPTNDEITAEQARLQAIEDTNAYARNRKAEYDQLNQFEMQFDDKRDGTTTWVDKINEIKGRYPKP